MAVDGNVKIVPIDLFRQNRSVRYHLPMGLIAIIGQFDVHAEDAESVGDLMRTMMKETQKEQGCIHYAFSTDLSTENRFQLSELWDSDAALAAHFRTPHMTTFRAGLAQLRINRRTVNRYDASNPAVL